jgi:E3 ubiquitin-protein ligase HERC4
VPGLWEVGVLQIAAGEAHCVAVGANGFAYAWGRGKYGQLGHVNFEDEEEPKQVRVMHEGVCLKQLYGDDITPLMEGPENTNKAAFGCCNRVRMCAAMHMSALWVRMCKNSYGFADVCM